MTRERDEDTGRYRSVYDDETILSTLKDTRLATSEIAAALGCHRTTAHDRLREMEENNLVKSTEVGNTLIWEPIED
ncbi:helix-turn-helix domain-containing protein [Haladaptatus sp. DFWS20]|uniref:helix-turn-helix domain-containing protein n=1 Tax=Haladaptatus sp. DFWS20 TaxID=3403467 RepID=UPI003EB79128